MSEYVIPATGSNVAMNTGAASSSTQRIVTASDSPEVVSVASIDTKTPALGQALAAASVPVVLPALTEGLIGSLTETAPATDTASSGLNGRLQRIAQRLTSLIAQLPATLGIKTAAASLSVAPASDAAFVLGAGTAAVGKLTANTGVTIGAVEIAATQTLATVTTVGTLTGSGVAHDAADSGNPHKIGAVATASLNGGTNVAAADRTDLKARLDGALITCNGSLEDIVTATPIAITDGSSTSLIAAQGAGIKTYITDVTICNTSATNVTVDLRDGAAGSVKWTFPVPAGGGVTHRFGNPIPFSANTAVCADPSAAASTVTVSAGGFKSKI